MWLTQRIVLHTLIWKVIASNLRESEIFNLEICSCVKVYTCNLGAISIDEC